MNKKGKLFLLPSGLGNDHPLDFLPASTIANINNCSYFFVEEIKTARRFLRKIGFTKNFDECFFASIGKHSEDNFTHFLKNTANGHDIYLMSEAGVPGVADPGSEVVKLAHQLTIQVVPLTGPSSILMALMSSGFNGQNFCFNGYLPIDKIEKVKKIKLLVELVQKHHQTQIFIETPFRNNQILKDIFENCPGALKLCIAMEITNPEEFIQTKTIDSWKKSPIDLHKKMCVFLLGQ